MRKENCCSSAVATSAGVDVRGEFDMQSRILQKELTTLKTAIESNLPIIADHLFLRPGENSQVRWTKTWEAINGCETGMPLMTSWPKDGYYTANKRSTDHGPRDIGPVVPSVLLLRMII
jgi:hypothetical protein